MPSQWVKKGYDLKKYLDRSLLISPDISIIYLLVNVLKLTNFKKKEFLLIIANLMP